MLAVAVDGGDFVWVVFELAVNDGGLVVRPVV